MGRPSEIPDLTGKEFGYWTVHEMIGKDKSGKLMYRCQCKCGAWSNVRAYELLTGRSKYCRSCSQKVRREGEGIRTPEEVRAYLADHTTMEAAEHFGVTRGGLQRYMKYHGIPWPKKRYAKPKRSQMIVITHRKPTPEQVAHARKAFNLKATPRWREGINDRSPHEERRWKWGGNDYLKMMHDYERKVAR